MKHQKTPSPWHRRALKLFAAFGLSLFFAASSAQAFDLDLMAGAFALNAKTGSSEGSVENLGAYRLGLNKDFLDRFEISVGYTVMLADIVAGDMSYGLDFSGRYFPLQSTANINVRSTNVQLEVEEVWRPYVGLGFHQRQFQSNRTNYAGFGLSLGVIRAMAKTWSFKGELRYVQLSGPGSSEASELTVVGGIRVPL